MMSIDRKLMNFIDETPNAYYCVDNLRKKLIEDGFVESDNTNSINVFCAFDNEEIGSLTK